MYKYLNLFDIFCFAMIARAFYCYQLHTIKHLKTLLTLISILFCRVKIWDSIEILK